MNKEKLFYEHGLNPLNYHDLCNYINSHESFKLKHIIEWCHSHLYNQVAEKLLSYIYDNKLDDMEAEYTVNSIPFNDFIERGKLEEYQKYLGYDMYKV